MKRIVFWKKNTQLETILHDRWLRRSRQISSLPDINPILLPWHQTYFLKDWLPRTFVEKPQFRLISSRISKFLEHYRGVLASSKICLSFFVACHRELTPWGFCTNKQEQLCLITVPNISQMKNYFEKVVRGQNQQEKEATGWLQVLSQPGFYPHITAKVEMELKYIAQYNCATAQTIPQFIKWKSHQMRFS